MRCRWPLRLWFVGLAAAGVSLATVARIHADSAQGQASAPPAGETPTPAGSTGGLTPRRLPQRQSASEEPAPELAAVDAIPVTPIDLAAALRLAGVQNPQILFARERVLEAVARRQFAAAQILPSLHAGVNFDAHTGTLQQASGNVLKVNRSSLYVGAGADAVAAGTVNIPGVGYSLNISDSIFNFLTARQLVEQHQLLSRSVENETLGRVAVGYTNLLEAVGRRSLTLQTRNEAQEVARLTASYAKTGLVPKADAERAATVLRDRDTDLVEAEASVLSASDRLAELLNVDPAVRLQPTEDRVVPQPVVPDTIPLTQLLAIAVLQRPDLAAQRTAIQQALLRVSAARWLAFSPTVFLGYSAGTYGGGSNLVASGVEPRFGAPPFQPRFDQFAPRSDFDVYMYWTLRNMGAGNITNIRLERSRFGAAELEQLVILNRVRAEVADAYVGTHVRFAQIAATERGIRSGMQAFADDMKRVRGGAGLPLELLDSLRLLGQARYEYLAAIVGYNQAQLRLYVALGQPPADMLARPVPQGPIPPPEDEKKLLR